MAMRIGRRRSSPCGRSHVTQNRDVAGSVSAIQGLCGTLLPGDAVAATAATALVRRLVTEGETAPAAFDVARRMVASWARHPSRGATLGAALAVSFPRSPGDSLIDPVDQIVANRGIRSGALVLHSAPAASGRRLVIDCDPTYVPWLLRSQSAAAGCVVTRRTWSAVYGTVAAGDDL